MDRDGWVCRCQQTLEYGRRKNSLRSNPANRQNENCLKLESHNEGVDIKEKELISSVCDIFNLVLLVSSNENSRGGRAVRNWVLWRCLSSWHNTTGIWIEHISENKSSSRKLLGKEKRERRERENKIKTNTPTVCVGFGHRLPGTVWAASGREQIRTVYLVWHPGKGIFQEQVANLTATTEA